MKGMSRRALCVIVLAGAAAAAGIHWSASAMGPAFVKTEHVYKTVGDLELKADVYRAEDDKPRPVVVWFHGEGFVRGNRDKPLPYLLEYCERKGYILVSFDYRLAPEAKLPDIIQDTKDGIDWIRESGPGLFHANPAKIIVTGESSGGYLALMTGTIIEQPVTGIVSFWGFGDIDGTWCRKSSKFHTIHYKPVAKDEARKIPGDKVLCRTTWDEGGKEREVFYIYVRQTGSLAEEIAGVDPERHPDKLRAMSPRRNVTSSYPPTLMIHGVDDEDIPLSCSTAMAEMLSRSGVSHELIRIDKGMSRLRGGDKEQVSKAREKVKEFITLHLEK